MPARNIMRGRIMKKPYHTLWKLQREDIKPPSSGLPIATQMGSVSNRMRKNQPIGFLNLWTWNKRLLYYQRHNHTLFYIYKAFVGKL